MDRGSPTYLQPFGRLAGFLRPYKRSLVVSIVLAIGSQVTGLALPWLTGEVIDEAIPNHDSELLAILVAAVAIAGLAKALMLVGRRFIAGRQALGVEIDVRNAL